VRPDLWTESFSSRRIVAWPQVPPLFDGAEFSLCALCTGSVSDEDPKRIERLCTDVMFDTLGVDARRLRTYAEGAEKSFDNPMALSARAR
jgi:hypothetical protein